MYNLTALPLCRYPALIKAFKRGSFSRPCNFTPGTSPVHKGFAKFKTKTEGAMLTEPG